MRKSLMAALGMLTLTAGSAGHAQAADIDADLRCIALISSALSQATPDKQGSMVAGMMYFIGRLDGQAPNADLEKELRRVVQGITQEQAIAEGQRCGAILTEKGKRLASVGSQLKAQK